MNLKKVIYKQELNVGDEIKVYNTGHEAIISEKTEHLHCFTYEVNPKDENDSGGGWYFSHDFLLT